MKSAPRTRPRFVRALLDCPDRPAALRLARSRTQFCDARTAVVILAEFNKATVGSRDRAEAAVRSAAAVAAVDRGDFCRALADRAAGYLAHLAGRPAEARRRLQRAAALLRGGGHAVEEGDVHRVLVEVLMRTGDDAGARRAADLAERCYKRGKAGPERLGGVAMNVGNLHHRRDEHREALEAYSRARRYYRRAGDATRLAHVDYNRANVLTSMDRTVEARRLYDAARKVYVARKIPALTAQTDFALAFIDLLEGRLDACLVKLRKARDAHEDLGDELRVAHDELDAAEAYLRLNRPADAESAAANAESFFQKASQLAEMATCAGIRGGAALQRGRAAEARRFFSRGRVSQKRLGNPVAAALLETGQARAEIAAGKPREAMRLAGNAARTLEARKLTSRQARALAVGAAAALAAGRKRQAQDWATRARDLARRRRDRRVELAALMVLARTLEAVGRPADAYRRLLDAERCVEQLRRGITTEESRLAFALDKSEVYEALILNRLQRGDRRSVEQALRFAERGKARALAERLSEGNVAVLGTRSRAARRLLDRLHDVEKQLALAESRLQDTDASAGLRSGRTERLEHLTKARLETLGLLSRSDPSTASLVGAAPPEPREIMRNLARDELVLEYAEAGGHYHLFAIDGNGVQAFPRIVSTEALRDRTDLLRFQMGKCALGGDHAGRFSSVIASTVRNHLERLHDLLLKPVVERLDAKRVHIVPHGLLHGIPFHALESDGVAVIERCSISYAPSLTTMGLLARNAPRRSTRSIVLGVPDRSAPLIEQEVEMVRRTLGNARVFRGPAATRRALHPDGERPGLLHVACHGFYSEDGPWSSGLRLGDAWFSLPELYGMRGAAELVVLSGCETGRGSVYSGDEWVGLVRGFLQAGARSVVASLWEIHDRGTVRLMEDFYEGLAGDLPVAEALAVAQRRARLRDPLPLHWAPFVVVGEGGLRIRLRAAA